VTASRAARKAIAELGYDPDRTLRYWLSPRFAADVQAGDPKLAVSTRRTVDNLLSVMLCDQASRAEFNLILTELSPDARLFAVERRARLRPNADAGRKK